MIVNQKRKSNFNKLLFLTIIFCIVKSYVYGQQIIFNKIFYSSGRHYCYDFVELKDSGYILVGSFGVSGQYEKTFSMRTDKFGDSLWTKKYAAIGESHAILKLNDSILIMGGIFDSTKLGIQLALINLNGDTLLSRDYGYSHMGLTSLEKTPDGGYAGRSLKFGGSDYDFFKLDGKLKVQWHKNLYLNNGRFKPDLTGGYVILSNSLTPVTPYIVARLDSAGNIIWQKNYGNQPAWDTDWQFPVPVIVLKDSNFLVGCTGHDWQLMKINYLNGDTLWTKNFDTAGVHNWNHFLAVSLDSASNNKYIFVTSAYVILLDSNGDSIWCKSHPIPNFYIRQIHQTKDGGFAMCGDIYDVNTSATYLAFAKLDSLGNSVFTSVYDPSNNFKQLTIYPNPAQLEFNISTTAFSQSEKLTVSLFDMQGRMMQQTNYTPNQPISISTLPPGMYAVEIRGKEKVVREKLVKE